MVISGPLGLWDRRFCGEVVARLRLGINARGHLGCVCRTEEDSCALFLLLETVVVLVYKAFQRFRRAPKATRLSTTQLDHT
jgi:hypothetical protein